MTRSRPPRRPAPRPARFRPRLEPLETRLAPTVYTVTSAADSGAGTPRAAIQSANTHANSLNAAGAPDEIRFGVQGPGVITLLPRSPLPTITDPVILDGTNRPAAWAASAVELDGHLAGAAADGLTVTAGAST